MKYLQALLLGGEAVPIPDSTSSSNLEPFTAIDREAIIEDGVPFTDNDLLSPQSVAESSVESSRSSVDPRGRMDDEDDEVVVEEDSSATEEEEWCSSWNKSELSDNQVKLEDRDKAGGVQDDVGVKSVQQRESRDCNETTT